MTEYWKSVRNNFEQIVASLALLFLPTQFGRHFWPPFSYVLGVRVDYLSPTIYLTDILIFLLFVSWISSCCGRVLNKKIRLPFLLVILFLTINIFFSRVPVLGLIYLLKIGELAFFGWYMGKFFLSHTRRCLWLLASGVLFESFLAIAQYFHQGSLNGPFYVLGERMYSGVTPGVANASINGQLVLRPYGTFPHPNVLAGYLVIAMTLIMGFGKWDKWSEKVFFSAALLLGTVALLLTLSRVAILVWCIILIFVFVRSLFPLIVKMRLFIYSFLVLGLVLFIVSVSLPFLLPRFFTTTFSDESITLRLVLAKDALAMMTSSPLLGVGLHNFLVAIPAYQAGAKTVFTLQPVHNIFLLIGAETGIIGLVISLFFVIFLYKKLIITPRHPSTSGEFGVPTFSQSEQKRFALFLLITLSEIVILGMFDHYFLTIQQGQLLLALVIGLALSF